MPKVSICVPIYNVEKYVRRCLDSLINQSLDDIEIIIVNDCTPDNSMQIINEYAKNDSRIRLLTHGQNKGLMWTRKTGYMAAVGDYVTFCDSDDTLTPDAVELLYKAAIQTNADIVAGNLRYISVKGEEIEHQNILNYGADKESVYKSLLLREFNHNVCGKLFKRTLLQDYNYQTFEQFTNGEDGCLFYQLVENSNHIVSINKGIYNYYQNVESSTQIRLSEKGIRSIAILNKIRVEKCSKYPNLNRLLYRYVFTVFNNQLMMGYGFLTKKYFREFNLHGFIGMRKACNYFTSAELFKMVLKRLYGIIRR